MTNKGRVKVGIIGSRFEGDIHAASFQMVPDAAITNKCLPRKTLKW
jgi:hypothetical protein